jgi:DNA-binding SARP family transcriptional activator
MHLSCLAHLMQYYRHQGSHAQAVAYGEAILQRDPLREEIHRELMRSYVANGQRALALRQYERCRQVLAEELGIPPMEETQLLRRQILAGSAPPIPAALVPGDVPRVLQELQAVVRGLEAARVEVEQAVKTVEQLSAHSPHT